MDYLRAFLGLAFIIAIAYAFSANRKAIDWRLVIIGLIIQLVFGLLIGKVELARSVFVFLSEQFVRFLSFAQKGAEFLYGDLSRNSEGATGVRHNLGFLFAFQALPTVIFFSAITSALYYLGILQKIVYGFAWVMARTMRLSGSESLSASANIFMGQTEAPLLVRPFIATMTQSELHCVMVGGMATLAGSVLAAYVYFLGGSNMQEQSRFATYLLSASIMNAPAAIVLSKLFFPETERDRINTNLSVSKDRIGVNLVDAIATGASDGLKLALNIGAMLLAFIAIIYALNWILVDMVGGVTGLNGWVEKRQADCTRAFHFNTSLAGYSDFALSSALTGMNRFRWAACLDRRW